MFSISVTQTQITVSIHVHNTNVINNWLIIKLSKYFDPFKAIILIYLLI